MQRIQDTTAAASLPAVPTLAGTVGYFTEGVVGVTSPTLVRGWWTNMVQEELMSLLTAAGITPDTAGTNFTQVLQALFALPMKNFAVFTSSGTWTVPANVTRAYGQCWAPGGGSGGSWGSGSAALGGGAGGYSEGPMASLTPGANITITIGTPGTAGASASTPGNGGNATASSIGAFMSANGGAGGASAVSSPAGGVANGGTGIGGILQISGGESWNPFTGGAGVVTSAGGASPRGGAMVHQGSTGSSAAGIAGHFPGGGASGSAQQAAGAIGGGGLVIISW